MKITFILAAALILRLINLNQSLWLDEAINVVNSQKFSFYDFLTVYSIGDFHPPLYFAILWIWTRFFGTSEIIVRLPSILLGISTVWLIFLIGKQLFNKKTALIAALILTFNPLHIYYSQEARMYSLAAFSVAFSFWALINLIKNKKYFLLIYGLSITLILYSDYLIYFAIVSQLVYILWCEKEKLASVINAMVIGGLIWSPWLLIFPKQLSTGQTAASQIPGWANVVGGTSLKEVALVWVKSLIGRVTFENKLLYGAVISIISLIYGFIIWKSTKPFNKEIKLLLCWTILPVLLALIVSFYIPVLSFFRMLFILPGLALIVAKGLENLPSRFRSPALSLVLLISSIFLLHYYFNPKYQREDWKGAMSYIREKNAYVYFEDNNIPAPAQYYQCGPYCFPAIFNFPAANESDLVNLKSLTTYQNKVYLFDYFVEISDPNRLVARKLEEAGFKNTETTDFNGVGFIYEFSK